MAILDIFKKKKEESKPVSEPLVKKTDIKQPVRQATQDIHHILKNPYIAEKSTDLLKLNQYVFKVWQRANKSEIKKAIENLYKVDVLAVRIINIPKKKKISARMRGWKAGYKKAIVK